VIIISRQPQVFGGHNACLIAGLISSRSDWYGIPGTLKFLADSEISLIEIFKITGVYVWYALNPIE